MRALVVQNCETESIGRYGKGLAARSVAHDVVQAHLGQPIPSIEGYDLCIVGGTPVSARDAHKHAYLRDECAFLETVLRTGKPCLGICCGGQLLAQLLGAQVRQNPVMEIGVSGLRLTADGLRDPILAGFPAAFRAFQWHQDAFGLPAGGRWLVEGDACAVQMFRCSNVVGTIFHLEISAADAERWVAAYAHELDRFGTRRDDVLKACADAEAEMLSLADRLINNLLALAGDEASVGS